MTFQQKAEALRLRRLASTYWCLHRPVRGRSSYVNHKCRCEQCTTAWRLSCRARHLERAALRVLVDRRWTAPLPSALHGSSSTYGNWSCRCVPCTAAAARDRAFSRARAVAA